MAEPSGREIVERYAKAMGENDLEAMPFLLADDMEELYPQSGERITGLDNWMALMRRWPEVDAVNARLEQIVGSDDEWVAGPGWSLLRIAGTGDQFWVSGQVTYANGDTWHAVMLLELHDGKIRRIRSYFAAPFEAPEWRRPYVEQMSPEA
jgi:limonene-1,2-epoxide hydrolase